MEYLETININHIAPNPYQPRLEFNTKELEELADSIKINGLIQPIIVRPSAVFGYELVAGERRLRAAKLAKLESIPAIIKSYNNDYSMQLAIVENLQRSNLSPIEEAKAYSQLLQKKSMTHEELAKYMGKSRPYISNTIRLLNLPPLITSAIEEGKLSSGHARALLSLPDASQQKDWYQRILTEDISVRRLEKLLKQEKKTNHKSLQNKDVFLKHQENELAQFLGSKVKLTINKDGAGNIKIAFDNQEELNRIINTLK
ncbi:ParB/RepB/Spo0J family partition protein [Streptococcus agalactiae]|nr:ParB/RepB/Spo0J family partition protein [Streptococcus agalactiae]